MGVSAAPTRVFVARLAGHLVYDPNGDQVGKVRDVVVSLRVDNKPPRVLGLVVEVLGRRRVFVPMTRVTSVDSGQVITTGLVNMRRFEQRPTEALVVAELLDRRIRIIETGETAVVYDVAMERAAPAIGRSPAWPFSPAHADSAERGIRRCSSGATSPA